MFQQKRKIFTLRYFVPIRYVCVCVCVCDCVHTHDLLGIHVEHHSIGLRIGRYLIFCHVPEQHLCFEPVTLFIKVK